MKSALTGRSHTNDGAQTAIQQKRLSDLPAASRLWTNGTPRQSTEWRPRGRKWFINHSSSALEMSGKQWRQEELSFFLRGERWATARCRFRRTRKSRNTEVQDSGQSGDLPLDIGPLRWAYLASSSASVHASLSSHRPGSGCQPRLDSLHARLPSISECSAANTADKVRTNDTHYCFIDIDYFWLIVLSISFVKVPGAAWWSPSQFNRSHLHTSIRMCACCFRKKLLRSNLVNLVKWITGSGLFYRWYIFVCFNLSCKFCRGSFLQFLM